jgi:hypothetical protein
MLNVGPNRVIVHVTKLQMLYCQYAVCGKILSTTFDGSPGDLKVPWIPVLGLT